MDNNKEIVEQMEKVLAENVMLKQENIQLREHLKLQKNWTSIREGYLLPMFRAKYGYGDCMYSRIIAQVGNIVKEYLGVSRFTEITEVNYEFAKEMSISLVSDICHFEWEHLRELQEKWGK